jgi:hypothetical protein
MLQLPSCAAELHKWHVLATSHLDLRALICFEHARCVIETGPSETAVINVHRAGDFSGHVRGQKMMICGRKCSVNSLLRPKFRQQLKGAVKSGERDSRLKQLELAVHPTRSFPAPTSARKFVDLTNNPLSAALVAVKVTRDAVPTQWNRWSTGQSDQHKCFLQASAGLQPAQCTWSGRLWLTGQQQITLPCSIPWSRTVPASSWQCRQITAFCSQGSQPGWK